LGWVLRMHAKVGLQPCPELFIPFRSFPRAPATCIRFLTRSHVPRISCRVAKKGTVAPAGRPIGDRTRKMPSASSGSAPASPRRRGAGPAAQVPTRGTLAHHPGSTRVDCPARSGGATTASWVGCCKFGLVTPTLSAITPNLVYLPSPLVRSIRMATSPIKCLEVRGTLLLRDRAEGPVLIGRSGLRP